eukprot:CAMPEP_0170568314 /NCGR_PEP_ID=MMETSP0211-20121228/81097_1 /TAXON_ID=311385 /ORGANISM="Pseudokeronopsis sp., Strain OXSARD2" /LENGTH=35 /DNA_ID= /DNA_START= /DNA_END= /DNA_ORIENTATION=
MPTSNEADPLGNSNQFKKSEGKEQDNGKYFKSVLP